MASRSSTTLGELVRAYQGLQSGMDDLDGRLRQAQSWATLGRAAGGFAHDFNNLANILEMAARRLAAELEDRPELHFEAQVIERAARRAIALCRRWRSHVGGENGRPVPELIDLDLLVTGMADQLERLAGDAIALGVVASGRGVRVAANGGEIEHVILELVANARDAMPFGGVLTITVLEMGRESGYSRSTRPNRYGVIEVCDTGGGIDPAVRSRLFEPFFTTKPAGKGTGLGLALAHETVRRYGGEILVESSQAPQGSRFRVLLPVMEATSGEPRRAPESSRSTRRPRPRSTVPRNRPQPFRRPAPAHRARRSSG